MVERRYADGAAADDDHPRGGRKFCHLSSKTSEFPRNSGGSFRKAGRSAGFLFNKPAATPPR
jgi:hypothetical protein